MTWHGVVNIKATLETEYEFGDDGLLSAETEQEAKTKALIMLHEDILEMSYRNPEDLFVWLQDTTQCNARPDKPHREE